VYSDVMMPYKDGYTLAKEIREKIAKFLLSFTAKSMKEDVLKDIRRADDYLNKPLIQKFY
jgi:CheY-like chemotaxis protein